MRRVCSAVCALVTAASPALAENQIWTSADFAVKPFDNRKLELALKSELRFQPDGDLDTVVLRPGIGYRLSPRYKVSGGYRWGSTRRSGPDRIEHRTWQQLSYRFGEAHGVRFDGRSRLEQRWRKDGNDTGWRWRQEFGVSRPLEGTPFELSVSTDLFFELNETDWGQTNGFSAVRSKATIEWDVSDSLSLEFGYINQFQNRKSAPDQTDHHILIGLSKDF